MVTFNLFYMKGFHVTKRMSLTKVPGKVETPRFKNYLTNVIDPETVWSE